MTSYVRYEITFTEQVLEIVKKSTNPNNTMEFEDDKEVYEYSSERYLEVFDNLNILMRMLETDVCELNSETEKFEIEINLHTRLPIIAELLIDFASKNTNDDVRIYFNPKAAQVENSMNREQIIIASVLCENEILKKEIDEKKLIIAEYEKQLRYWEMQH